MTVLDGVRVKEILVDCLFQLDECIDGKPPSNKVVVQGTVGKFAFHPERLESHREEIKELLNLPIEELLCLGRGLVLAPQPQFMKFEEGKPKHGDQHLASNGLAKDTRRETIRTSHLKKRKLSQ